MEVLQPISHEFLFDYDKLDSERVAAGWSGCKITDLPPQKSLITPSSSRGKRASCSSEASQDILQLYDRLSEMFSPFDTIRQTRAQAHALRSSYNQDSLSFLDESFFYIEQVDSFQSVHFGSNPSGSSLDGSHRTRFAELLENCHQHRMSTIVEAPVMEFDVGEESSLVEYFKISERPLKSRNSRSSRHSRNSRTSRSSFHVQTPPRNPVHKSTRSLPVTPTPKSSHPQREGFKKILDYIIPYPTHWFPVKKKSALVRLRRKPAHRTKLSPLCSLDDDWITHGFFEVLSGRQWTANTVDV